MISTNDVLGLIFASMHDDAVIDLTKKERWVQFLSGEDTVL